MASQDYISQYTQGIPPTQPERSPSRTPRRDPPSVAYDAFVPGYRGPLHMATHSTMPQPLLRLHAHLDPTTFANDAAIHNSFSHALELHGTTSTLCPATLPSGTTDILSSTAASSGIHYTTTIHYNLTQVTLTHPTIFHVANPQRLPCASMRDPGYATLEAGRGLPRYRKGQWD